MTKGFALLLGCVALAGGAHALEPDVLFSKVSPSVWAVRTFDVQERPLRFGSAVVVAPGRLVTNCHVLAKASAFVVRQDNVSYGATLEHPDPARDLCQIRVANFSAPPVQMAPAGAARVGQRVYAIGNPRGLENTLSEGILSGLRGGDDAEARLLQTTAAISPGSSGGGLFDSEGRLLGITTFGAQGSGNLNFAVPSEFVVDIPARAKAALAARALEPAQAGRAPVGTLALTDPLRPGDALEYVRIDKLTGNRSPVIYRLDRIGGDELFFNAGGRVEKADGRVVSIVSPAGGMFDSSSPPGGWARKDVRPGMRWHVDYVAAAGDKRRHELDVSVGGERAMRVDGTEIKVLEISFEGWVYDGYGTVNLVGAATRFGGTVWYSPDLGRVVRFEALNASRVSTANEILELVRVLR